MTPLKIAYQKDNSEAAKLLLEHGAKVNAKDVFILKGDYYTYEKNKTALYALRSEIPKEMTQTWEAKFLVSKWVQLWIKKRLAHKSDEHDGTLEFEVVSLLLKHGFPVNNTRTMTENHIDVQKTLLDDLLAENRLPPEDKDKMVSLLRSYNAKTFAELLTCRCPD